MHARPISRLCGFSSVSRTEFIHTVSKSLPSTYAIQFSSRPHLHIRSVKRGKNKKKEQKRCKAEIACIQRITIIRRSKINAIARFTIRSSQCSPTANIPFLFIHRNQALQSSWPALFQGAEWQTTSMLFPARSVMKAP